MRGLRWLSAGPSPQRWMRYLFVFMMPLQLNDPVNLSHGGLGGAEDTAGVTPRARGSPQRASEVGSRWPDPRWVVELGRSEGCAAQLLI